ncbi:MULTISPECIES: HigA family addiction module antitoxin [Photorhabdus]|uniref:Addiction module antidote protein, HigA family n=2 Tax=Photorhabdus TaxID=29487 RepID=A0A329VFY4_9GAMM|nr:MULTISPECIES: HigA family addiction module antitoxin [Photorhabdus]PQQ30523.1 addiction module antidote protein, HigA family [Photorhabdus luminescens]MBS9433329.1 addiction module antidote protein, HigA family [Photorhabdus hainanensis]PQQ35016.1 addiction module antidote protein, HigA family [Photorhabdus luminescens]PQQ37492.1 addiction module antidote protein, HigA family [Photorhabdus luminescens]PQQ38049.1 addiction module antidote protein, HigA family [Photorhabdus luminescens]
MDTKTAEPTTVGEMLTEEFLKPLKITQQQLANAMGVSRKVIGQIVNNSRRLSVAEATQLAGLFETDEDFWINLQAAHDRWESRQISARKHYAPITVILSAS